MQKVSFQRKLIQTQEFELQFLREQFRNFLFQNTPDARGAPAQHPLFEAPVPAELGLGVPERADRPRDLDGGGKEMIEKMKWNTSNFEGLVLGCMDSYDSNQILILQHFSRSTRFSYFCTAQISKFQQKIVKIFGGMKKFHFISFAFFDGFCDFSAKFWWNFAGISQKWSGNDKMSRDFEKCEKIIQKKRKKKDRPFGKKSGDWPLLFPNKKKLIFLKTRTNLKKDKF